MAYYRGYYSTDAILQQNNEPYQLLSNGQLYQNSSDGFQLIQPPDPTFTFNWNSGDTLTMLLYYNGGNVSAIQCCGYVIPPDQINGYIPNIEGEVILFTLDGQSVDPPDPDLQNILIKSSQGWGVLKYSQGWRSLGWPPIFILNNMADNITYLVQQDIIPLNSCDIINQAVIQKYTAGSISPGSDPVQLFNTKTLFWSINATDLQYYTMTKPDIVPTQVDPVIYVAYNQDNVNITNLITDLTIYLNGDTITKYVIILYFDLYVIYHFYYVDTPDQLPVITNLTNVVNCIPDDITFNLPTIGIFESSAGLPNSLFFTVNGNQITVNTSTLPAGQSGFFQYYSTLNGNVQLVNQLISLPPPNLFNNRHCCVETNEPGYNAVNNICPDGWFVNKGDYDTYNDIILTNNSNSMMFIPRYGTLRGGRSIGPDDDTFWTNAYLGNDTIAWGYNRGIGYGSISSGWHNNAINVNSNYSGINNDNFMSMIAITYDWNNINNTLNIISGNIVNLAVNNIISFTDSSQNIYLGSIVSIQGTTLTLNTLTNNRFQLPIISLTNQTGRIKIIRLLGGDIVSGNSNDTADVGASIISGYNNTIISGSNVVAEGQHNLISNVHDNITTGQSNICNADCSIISGQNNTFSGDSNIQSGQQNIISGNNIISSGHQNNNHYMKLIGGPGCYYNAVFYQAVMSGYSSEVNKIILNSMVVITLYNNITIHGNVISVSSAGTDLIITISNNQSYLTDCDIKFIHLYVQDNNIISGDQNINIIGQNNIQSGSYNKSIEQNSISAGHHNDIIYEVIQANGLNNNEVIISSLEYPGILNYRFTDMFVMINDIIKVQDEYILNNDKVLVLSSGTYQGTLTIRPVNSNVLLNGEYNNIFNTNGITTGYYNTNNGVNCSISGQYNSLTDGNSIVSGSYNYSNTGTLYNVSVEFDNNVYTITSTTPLDWPLGSNVVVFRSVLKIIGQINSFEYTAVYVSGNISSGQTVGDQVAYLIKYRNIDHGDNIISGWQNIATNMRASVIMGFNNSVNTSDRREFATVIGRDNFNQYGSNHMWGQNQKCLDTTDQNMLIGYNNTVSSTSNLNFIVGQGNSSNSNNNHIDGQNNIIASDNSHHIVHGYDNKILDQADNNYIEGQNNEISLSAEQISILGQNNKIGRSGWTQSNSIIIGQNNGTGTSLCRDVINSYIIGNNNQYNIENSCIIGNNYTFEPLNVGGAGEVNKIKFRNSILLGNGSQYTIRMPPSPAPGTDYTLLQGMLLALDSNASEIGTSATSDLAHRWANNQCIMRYTGGFYFYNSNSASSFGGTGVQLPRGAASWIVMSSRADKVKISDVDHELDLEKLDHIPVERWYYKHNPELAYTGPYAEDLYQYFETGQSGGIQTIEMDGILMSCLKGLYSKYKKLQQDHDELKAMVMELLNK